MARACLSSRRVKDFRVVTAQPFSWLMDFRRGTRSIVNIAEVGGEFWELAVCGRRTKCLDSVEFILCVKREKDIRINGNMVNGRIRSIVKIKLCQL